MDGAQYRDGPWDSEHPWFTQKNAGIVLDEPSVVALNSKNGGAVLAVGKKAKEMYGRTPPDSIRTIRPMKDGVIADFDVTKAMIRHFVRAIVPQTVIQPTYNDGLRSLRDHQCGNESRD